MGIRRDDTRTKTPKGGQRTPEQIWGDELEYRTTRIQEAAQAIRDLARRRSPVWTSGQIKEVIETIEGEAQLIRDAYETPTAVQAFRFSDQTPVGPE